MRDAAGLTKVDLAEDGNRLCEGERRRSGPETQSEAESDAGQGTTTRLPSGGAWWDPTTRLPHTVSGALWTKSKKEGGSEGEAQEGVFQATKVKEAEVKLEDTGMEVRQGGRPEPRQEGQDHPRSALAGADRPGEDEDHRDDRCGWMECPDDLGSRGRTSDGDGGVMNDGADEGDATDEGDDDVGVDDDAGPSGRALPPAAPRRRAGTPSCGARSGGRRRRR